MKHHKSFRIFGRTRSQRKALLRHLAEALIENGRIVTTEAKAKELRPFVEKMITRGKDDSVASRRLLISRLGSDKIASKVVKEISPKYQDRQGGYTRVLKLPPRGTDAAPMALIEFV